ncbi:branched-chain amino acid ABC transporter ATP-binding protein [Zhengella mangrovi]|uniref:Branched-chain amino acid ABC transporter ATP-binding protein n=1 Tax=Zhengella mangrovi TaxID=1982044 RepID=A0A2G1QGL7_9HYPH|nr:ABC transporter ATP-binding protein [Zhengella mangrovi]PHP64600.1 branched-chain amino acid ABC transporter ATP-binding protein [Zhengella mangrovi]
MLSVENLSVSYGNVRAVSDLSLRVAPGSVVGLVGANGAGKTSTLNALTGFVGHGATVIFEGQNVSGRSTADLVRLGLVQVAQGRQLFPEMTVLENLEMGGFLWRAAEMRQQVERMYEKFPVLQERRNQAAGTLSGGEQQMLAVARGLMARPKLLLIDEPCLGLAPKMVDRLGELIRQINEDGISILLVEQNTAFVFRLASHAYVLENGQCVLEGTPDELRSNDRVRSAYLGI